MQCRWNEGCLSHFNILGNYTRKHPELWCPHSRSHPCLWVRQQTQQELWWRPRCTVEPHLHALWMCTSSLKSKHSSAMTVQTLRVWLCPASLFYWHLSSLTSVSTEEFMSCRNELCDSKQLLTTPFKVLWKQYCQIHLISPPDSCSLRKRLDPLP